MVNRFIKYCLVSAEALAPKRSNDHAIGFDLYTTKDYEIYPGSLQIVDTGLVVKVPYDMYYKVHIRSGISFKNKISLINDTGLIDPDYCGPEDTIKIGLFKHLVPEDIQVYCPTWSKEVLPLSLDLRIRGLNPTRIKKGERIAQIEFLYNSFVEHGIIELKEVSTESLLSSRGGLGSTGEMG